MSSYEMLDRSPVYVINEQPTHIDNVFTLGSGERVRKTYECDDSCCGFGPQYTVTLTDSRIIQRQTERCCGCTSERTDSMLFLSDISSLKNKAEFRCNDCDCWSILCWPCICLCSLCHRKEGMPITLRGPFGVEVFTVKRTLALDALAEIPKAARIHKITTQPSESGTSRSPEHYQPPKRKPDRGKEEFRSDF